MSLLLRLLLCTWLQLQLLLSPMIGASHVLRYHATEEEMTDWLMRFGARLFGLAGEGISLTTLPQILSPFPKIQAIVFWYTYTEMHIGLLSTHKGMYDVIYSTCAFVVIHLRRVPQLVKRYTKY